MPVLPEISADLAKLVDDTTTTTANSGIHSFPGPFLLGPRASDPLTFSVY